MEQIKAFADRVNAAFDKFATGIDGVVADVTFLKEQIAAFQNSPGALTPEDQALLDAIEARLNTTAEKVAALDAATPPKPV